MLVTTNSKFLHPIDWCYKYLLQLALFQRLLPLVFQLQNYISHLIQ